ncbi:MAG: nucleotidyltransferase family protein [Gaiellaceae bacterium]
MNENERLITLIAGCPWLMDALRAARAVGAPQWVIGAGALRDLVFEHLHGRAAPPPRDIDYAFFDLDDVSVEHELAVENQLRALRPGLPFEARNQARVHLWYEQHFGYPIEPYRSIEHAVATWPETATAVACRLREDDGIELIAPLGLDDLLAGVLRRNPAQVTTEIFRQRLARRPDLAKRWPNVQIVFD